MAQSTELMIDCKNFSYVYLPIFRIDGTRIYLNKEVEDHFGALDPQGDNEFIQYISPENDTVPDMEQILAMSPCFCHGHGQYLCNLN
jgi:hypothetical protein